MKVLLLGGLLLVADKAVILNDQEQKDFVQALDLATRAQGLSVAPAMLRLYHKLLNAPVVTEQKEPDHETK